MNRFQLLAMALVVTAGAASSTAQAQTPKKSVPPATPIHTDLLQGARAYAAALRATPVGKLTKAAPVSAANAGPVPFGKACSIDLTVMPAIVHKAAHE